MTKQEKVEGETRKFYANLYKSNERNISGTIESFLGSENAKKCPKISNQEADALEGVIKVSEATNYMKTCRADASPGSSGFTGGFVKLFWRNLKVFLVNALNFAYEKENLSLSQNFAWKLAPNISIKSVL